MSCRSVFCCLSNNYMISFKSSKCNIISQSLYDSEIRRICSCISSFPCPFCRSCSLIFYGHYQRRICVPDCPEFIIIKVQRVFCTHCGRTHALLPDLWLPRSPVPVSLVSVIASLSHHQFSAFQNTFYPLTDRFLYSLINGSERFHRMLILSCTFFISTNMTETLFSWIHHLSTNTTCHCEIVKSTFYK